MSSVIEAKKLKEGGEAMKQAQKALKTTWTKWKPDHEKAAMYYREAIKCLMNVSSDAGKALYLDALECSIDPSIEIRDEHTAGANAEKAAKIYCEKKDTLMRGVALYERASLSYRTNESFDKSATMLINAAKKLAETNNADKCIELLFSAVTIFEEENRGYTGGEAMKTIVSTAIEIERFDDALALLSRHSAMMVKLDEDEAKDDGLWLTDGYKNTLSQVVIHFHRGNFKAAKKVFDEAEVNLKGFTMAGEYDAGFQLLSAYEKGSEEDLAVAVKMSPFMYLPNRVARLAKKLTLPEEAIGQENKLGNTLEGFLNDNDDQGPPEEFKTTKDGEIDLS